MNSNGDDINKSICDHFETKKPYLIIMRNGHEYNAFLDLACADGWIEGKVAKRMMVTLHGETNGLTLSLDTEEQAKLRGDIYVQEPCSVRHPWQSIRIWADDISILEDSWRKALDTNDDGTPNEESLVKTFPEFGAYRNSNGGFCTNPEIDVK